MANLIALTDGNLTAAGSWAVADTTSASIAGLSFGTAPTTAGPSADSNAFTPGAITIDGILLELQDRRGVTGTCTVTLRNDTAGSDVASVTINMSDLPPENTVITAPGVAGSWHFFYLGVQVLLPATDYKVRVVNSEAGTAAKVRVFMQFQDEADTWSTVGVSENIIEASWQALVDAVEYKLLKG